jgi:hypothetical protein
MAQNKVKTAIRLGIALSLIAFIFASCDFEKKYYKGYHNAWDGKFDQKLYKGNPDYKNGYDRGQKESEDFNRGCDDVRAGKEAHYRFKSSTWYMKGYEDCRLREGQIVDELK